MTLAKYLPEARADLSAIWESQQAWASAFARQAVSNVEA